ncbi:MAG: hypothetical protein M0P73_16895 [Syntrophobacterales bacterium]|jgi:hypothetical protein|nr:hypothetical protein [Syntrophobacterales bacterium]
MLNTQYLLLNLVMQKMIPKKFPHPVTKKRPRLTRGRVLASPNPYHHIPKNAGYGLEAGSSGLPDESRIIADCRYLKFEVK